MHTEANSFRNAHGKGFRIHSNQTPFMGTSLWEDRLHFSSPASGSATDCLLLFGLVVLSFASLFACLLAFGLYFLFSLHLEICI